MTKMLFVLGILSMACGSADTDFGAAVPLVVDAGADVRASGGSGGTGAGGAPADTGKPWPAECGPVHCEGKSWATNVTLLKCNTDADCCRGVRCYANKCQPGPSFVQCQTETDCPCGWSCPVVGELCKEPPYL